MLKFSRLVPALSLSVLLLTAPALRADDPPKPDEPQTGDAQPAAEEPADPPYSMPTENIFTADELATKFEYRKSVPYGDATLAVLLPCRPTWKWLELSNPTKLDSNRMVPLARVEPPDDPDVAIEMKVITLPREVRLEDWVDFFADTQGLFVVHGQAGNYHGRHVLDTVCEFQVKDGRTFVARAGFFKCGKRVYMIAGSAPKDKYEEWSADFGLAVTSGTPVTLETNDFAEPMREYRFPAGRKYAFTHPASWSLKELSDLPTGVNAVDLFQEDEKAPVALIKVRVFDKTRIEGIDVEKVTWTVLEEVKSASPKFEVLDKIRELPASTEEFPGPGKMVIYRADLDGSPIEIHELVLDGPESIFSAHLITAPKQRAPWLWMVNRRAWEIVGARIKITE